MSQNSQSEERTHLAEQRTDWAEDRTVLANERTFAGWMRTGLASAGLGLGFNAVFKAVEPTYLAKGVATIFIVIAILIFWAAYRNACALVRRMSAHAVEPIKVSHIKLLTLLFSGGAVALGVVLWIL